MISLSIAENCTNDRPRLFSPLHRDFGGLPLTRFEYLSADRLVQRTRFGAALEMTADFRAKTIVATRLKAGLRSRYP